MPQWSLVKELLGLALEQPVERRAILLDQLCRGEPDLRVGGMPGIPGMEDPSDAGLQQTVSEAFANSAKGTIEQLEKTKKK